MYTRKIYNSMVDSVILNRYDNFFGALAKNHPEKLCSLYDSKQTVNNLGVTHKAYDMLTNGELNSSLLIRLSLIFTLTTGVDKNSIKPFTHLISESTNKVAIQIPVRWMKSNMIQELGGTPSTLLALLSYSVNRFADIYSAFNMKDAISYIKKDFDIDNLLELRPKANMVYMYEIMLISYLLNKTQPQSSSVVFRPEENTMAKLKEELKGCEDVDNPQAVRLVERLIKNKISWLEINCLASLWEDE